LVQRCYFNYLRVYVPEGARLLAAEGLDPASITTLPGENGTSILAGTMTLPPGQAGLVRLRYELPAGTIEPDRYQLRLLKQPGTPGWPVTIALQDATGSWSPGETGAQMTGEGLKLDMKLYTDVDLEFERAN
jgi:hypothetical protein